MWSVPLLLSSPLPPPKPGRVSILRPLPRKALPPSQATVEGGQDFRLELSLGPPPAWSQGAEVTDGEGWMDG